MEIMIKKCFSAFLLLLAATGLRAQEVVYSLPSTTFVIEVDAVQEYFFAGPYAAYASRMLGFDAARQNSVKAHVTRLRLLPCVEADPSVHYPAEVGLESLLTLSSQGLVSFRDTLEARSLSWRFSPVPRRDYSDKGLTSDRLMRTETTMEMVQVDTGFVQMPVTREVMQDKTLEDKAAEAAEIILSVRQERMNIAMGHTDATFSGEALAAALEELSRIEEEYLALFRGYTVSRPLHGVFDVRPSSGERVQRYVAFLLSDQDGLKPDGKGTPYYLELEVESEPEGFDGGDRRRRSIRFREPAICRVRLSEDGRQLLETRAPVYQLGKECIMSINK